MGADWITSEPQSVQNEFLNALTIDELRALPYLFDFWAMPHQLQPEGDWRSWVILGGRGAGKTRAGAEWVRAMIEGSRPRSPGTCQRIALVGETLDQAREVMVFGESGIMACSPPDRRPHWHAARRMLEWPSGATAQLFSAQDPDSLRGPQFDGVWADEVAKWKKGEDVWDMLQFALRLGVDPRACVTTTPRNSRMLKGLLAQPTTVVTHAPTSANRANLAAGFLAEVYRRYAGTRLGRQELDGTLLSDAEGAMWTTESLAEAQEDTVPDLTRIVVAVDPPASGHQGSDECGIVVVGAVTKGPPQTWKAYVLEDATIRAASPSEWATAAIKAMRRHNADRLIAEVNQGGAMVGEVLRSVDPFVPYKAVHASQGKTARAEPIAALYEQGKVRHVRGLDQLEEQMCQMTTSGYDGKGSPDRVDALVWALHELMIAPMRSAFAPKIRRL